jgi:SAM-dependent methyltransferase
VVHREPVHVLALRRARREARRLTPRRTRRPLEEYLASHTVRKLHLGAGGNVLPGWLNTDRDVRPGVAYLDVARPFPLPSEAFDYVFAEHLVEHLPYDRGRAMVHECARVLRPGGTVRLATPDLARVASLAVAPRTAEQTRYVEWATTTFLDGRPPSASFVVNNMFYGWGHRFLYDAETLADVLRSSGLASVTGHAYGESDDVALAGLEGHAGPGDEEPVRFETMILQARKPG